MMMRPLDDPTLCAQSVVADLQPLRLMYVGVGVGPFDSPPIGTYYFPIDTHGLSLTVFYSYFAGPKSVSAHLFARPTRTR